MLDTKDSKLKLLTDKNSTLLLVDYQPAMIKSIASGDKVRIKSAAISAAKAAKILDIPVVISSINPTMNGDFLPEVTSLFPEQKVYARKVPTFDALEDEDVLSAVAEIGRKKLVISGLCDQHVLRLFSYPRHS